MAWVCTRAACQVCGMKGHFSGGVEACLLPGSLSVIRNMH
jgi:hypothetical protein